MEINCAIVDSYRHDKVEIELMFRALNECNHMAQVFEFDLFKIIEEKRTYNRTRLDHKRENRSKEGGKKF